MKTIITNPDLCTGCNRCAYACSAKKEGQFAPALARLSINTYAEQGYSVPSICFQCKRPDCLSACPERAIFKGIDDIIFVDPHRCIGCGECLPACSWGMIAMHPTTQKAFKCDLCGGAPACVDECPFEALTFVESEGEAAKTKARQMKYRCEEGTPAVKRDTFGKSLLTVAGR